MSIHDHEYLYKISKDLTDNEINRKILNYLFKEIELMLKDSIYRSSINEQWLYELILQQNDEKYYYQIYNLIKKMNLKLKDRSHPSYIPYLGRILQRLIKENTEDFNQDFFYHLYLSLILSNDYNTDDIHFNYFIEIHSLVNIQLTLKQLTHLIQCCLMTKNSEICRKFIEYLSNNFQPTNEPHIDYIIQFLSINIRATVYDLDEINRRIKTKRDILVKNGETIFDLRAKLARKDEEEDDEEEEEKSIKPIFQFEHYQYEKIPSHHFNIGDSVALIDQQELDAVSDEKPPLRLFYQAFGVILTVHPYLSIKFAYFPSSLTKNNYLNRQKLFRLERLPNFVTLNRSIDAFDKIIESTEYIMIKPFLNLSNDLDQNQLKIYAQEQIHQLEDTFTIDMNSINNSQRQAIKNALENRLTLIQGPPGTGKTETSAWIIHLWLKNFYQKGQTILVCAETHQAVDNLTRRLLKYNYRLIRYGEPRTVAPDLHVKE